MLLFKKSQLRGVGKPQSLHTKPAPPAAKASKVSLSLSLNTLLIPFFQGHTSPVKSAPQKKTTTPKKTQAAKPAPASGGITVLSEKTLFLGQKLTVIQGDISQLTVDAVVHPTNGNFSLAGQCGESGLAPLVLVLPLSVSQALRFAPLVAQVSTRLSRKCLIRHLSLWLKVVPSSLSCSFHLSSFPSAAISGSGTQLPCKHVLHVHSPSWGDDDAVTHLEKAVKNCLTLAENKNLSTVAFPSVASGS